MHNKVSFTARVSFTALSFIQFIMSSIKWWNGLHGRAAGLYILVKPYVMGSIPNVSHKFRILLIIIHVYLIKQPNDTLSQIYVQMYIRVD